jgi:hypothetical protein
MPRRERRQICLVGFGDFVESAPVQNRQRLALTTANDMPTTHLNPANIGAREPTALDVVDGVRVPYLDDEENFVCARASHRKVGDGRSVEQPDRTLSLNEKPPILWQQMRDGAHRDPRVKAASHAGVRLEISAKSCDCFTVRSNPAPPSAARTPASRSVMADCATCFWL